MRHELRDQLPGDRNAAAGPHRLPAGRPAVPRAIGPNGCQPMLAKDMSRSQAVPGDVGLILALEISRPQPMSNRNSRRLPAIRNRGLMTGAGSAPGCTHGRDEEERMTTGGFSPKRLARVRDVLARYIDAGYVPGAVAVVARHGEVHLEATGNLAFEGPGSRT